MLKKKKMVSDASSRLDSGIWTEGAQCSQHYYTSSLTLLCSQSYQFIHAEDVSDEQIP